MAKIRMASPSRCNPSISRATIQEKTGRAEREYCRETYARWDNNGRLGLLLGNDDGVCDAVRSSRRLPMTSPAAAQDNLEGIQQYNAGKWQQAKSRFESAIRADPALPEAHFNLALTLHKLGDHREATIHFKKASELAPNNKEILNSPAYRNHLGLSSTLEKHLSGGYRY